MTVLPILVLCMASNLDSAVVRIKTLASDWAIAICSNGLRPILSSLVRIIQPLSLTSGSLGFDEVGEG
jgi:hypothetical protein